MADALSGVFGREAELLVLTSFLDDVPAGPTALLLDGDAGVGKTTLWKQGVEAARSRSCRVLACQPVESEAKLSFAALGDLLGGILDETDIALPRPQTKALDVAMLRAEPEGAPPDSRAVAMAVLGVLRLVSRAGPVIVAIDDIQWLDQPTATVLEFVLRRLEIEPIGILASLRSGEETADPLGLDRSLQEGRLRRMTVGPLTVDALGHLLRVRLGADLARPTVGRLHAVSGGNPFFALEIARAFLRGDEPANGQQLPVPDSLRELVRRRVAALPAEDRDTLLAVAAMSAPSVALIEAVVGTDGTPEALSRGVEAGVVEIEADHVRFTHPLFGSAIFSEAPPEQRRALHRRLAAVSPEPEERARHLALGTEAPDPDVAAALDEAARRARSRGAPDAAGELSEMALRFTPRDRPEERLDRSLEAAKHHVAAGDAQGARVILEAAADAAPPGPLRARALRWLAFVRPADGSWTMALETFRRALDQAGGDEALRAEIEQGLGYACLFTGDLAAAEPHARSALELAERIAEPAVLAEALQFVAYVEFASGRGLRPDLLDRAVTLEQQTEESWVWDEVRPSVTRAQLLKYTDRFEEARSAFRVVLERALEQGKEHPVPLLHYHLAELECWAGNWEAAEDHARQSLQASIQLRETAHYRTIALYARALVDAHLGRTDAAREAASEGLELAEGVGPVTSQILNLSVLGFLELFQGNPAGTHRHLARAAELATAMGVEEPALFRFVPDEVEALVALGDLDAAAAMLDPFEERARRLDRAWALATGARCRGLLLAAAGDVTGALEATEHALTQHERVPEPFALARTHFSRGRIQRRAKLKAEARESFERALQIYADLGSRPWAERAGREARRVGVRAAGPFELTPTEQRVASFVAQGHSNREAADALFMSVNTVEWNLSRIYRKLGIRSRMELAAKLRSDE
jgi:ATP/maltotriose-dependent transcriptional regulator MalT